MFSNRAEEVFSFGEMAVEVNGSLVNLDQQCTKLRSLWLGRGTYEVDGHQPVEA